MPFREFAIRPSQQITRSSDASLGLFFYSLLKGLKRFIGLLPDAAVWVAEDLRTRAGLSPSYNAIASGREYRDALERDLCAQAAVGFVSL